MKGFASNEDGAVLPFTLLLFMVVCTAALFGTGIFVSKQQTALLLTDYYETKVIELMALQEILPLLEGGEAVSGSYRTDRGEVIYAAAPNEGEEAVVIHLKTNKPETFFTTKVVYHLTERQIIKWIE
ncbi:hypothetical protein [Bacillus badius]|uniref:Competence protein ComG n=1 Tax=Bacillus badius TaxID=1455 RepID=A0ABR5AZE4_BACBA|nr:hypothetical protein [Bacillus badius]KIL75286.1 hypothetical protein SD78_2355 [Bacillus badius]KIL79726.1 hypothetical protein SD77_2180 [Bacillus badius]KZR60366.1 hypothetical protein A3781_09330 [Bacillus badius]MED4715183.1 hypothetical protein [Bacillus badius]